MHRTLQIFTTITQATGSSVPSDYNTADGVNYEIDPSNSLIHLAKPSSAHEKVVFISGHSPDAGLHAPNHTLHQATHSIGRYAQYNSDADNSTHLFAGAS